MESVTVPEENTNKIFSVFDNLTDDEEVKILMYKEICQCTTQCFDISNKNQDLKNQYQLNTSNTIICNKIVANTDSNENVYVNLINGALKYLVLKKHLVKIGLKYYITNSNNNIMMKLSWSNIKNIESTNLKELFWTFRKLIVDSILKIIIIKYDLSKVLNVYSVGSNNLSSDYDITLYTTYDNVHEENKVIYKTIDLFKYIFNQYFGESSSIVFDTNVYGKSYIKIYPKNYTVSEYISKYYDFIPNCNQQTEDLYVLKKDVSVNKSSQISWALIKFLKNVKELLGEVIYNDYFSFLSNNLHLNDGNEYFTKIQNTILFLTNTEYTYNDLIQNEKRDYDLYKDKYGSELSFVNDYTSFVNFYGEETYFTRGAFIDTVVNSQMCNTNAVEMYTDDYIASILENAGFFFIHSDKLKYLKRTLETMNILIKNDKEYYKLIHMTEYNHLVSIANNNNKYCDWITQNDFNLLQCEKFKVFQILFKLLYNILKIHFKDNETLSISYYDYVINPSPEPTPTLKSKPRYGNILTVENNLKRTPTQNHRRRSSLKSIPPTNKTVSSLRNKFITEPRPISLPDSFDFVKSSSTGSLNGSRTSLNN